MILNEGGSEHRSADQFRAGEVVGGLGRLAMRILTVIRAQFQACWGPFDNTRCCRALLQRSSGLRSIASARGYRSATITQRWDGSGGTSDVSAGAGRSSRSATSV